MRTLVLASRKGGAGKTTLSGHLAGEAQRRAAGPVAIIDIDPMGSFAAWWNERQSDTPVCAGVGEGGLTAALQTLEESGVELVVIDTPPFATAEIAAIVKAADLVMSSRCAEPARSAGDWGRPSTSSKASASRWCSLSTTPRPMAA